MVGAMIPSPFVAGVGFACRRIVDPVAYRAPAEELAAIGESWVARRRTEFLQGRAAAAEALRAIDRSGPVPRGLEGEPCWPEGVVGALTHTRNLVAAAAAPRARLLGLGLDLEPAERKVSGEVSRIVCTPREREWVDRDLAVAGQQRPGLCLKLVFSAKESIFKATFPHARVRLGYHDAELELRDDHLEAMLQRDAGPALPAGSRLAIGFAFPELGPWSEASGPERSGSYLMTYLAIAARPT
jgi:4'-phosphopantetheinyl transferase EntD